MTQTMPPVRGHYYLLNMAYC